MKAKKGNVIAIVPARAGSKGVPGKNIKLLGGYPLIAYSIAAAKLCHNIDRAIATTDSPEIADISRFYGAEVPFLRPSELAQDKSPAIDYFRHALNWMIDHEGELPEVLVLLNPTTPLREPSLIDLAIETFRSDREATSLRSAHELQEPPQKMMCIRDGYLDGFFPDDPRPEYYNLPRQTFPPAYHPNGYVEIVCPDMVLENSVLFGPKVLGFITPMTMEVDRMEEFEYLEYVIEKKGHPLHEYLKAAFPVKK